MIILAVEAHPDDVEVLCAGTLARLSELGHSIKILSLSAGECGAVSLTREQSIQTRTAEARKAASVIGAEYHCAGIRDKHIFFNEEIRNRVCELFRTLRPDVVFTHSPQDYILDHEFTSMLTRDAATAASARLFETGIPDAAPPTEAAPYLYYCEPVGGTDVFGDPVRSTTFVDITKVMDTKEKMFGCYVSQLEWLRHRFGTDMIEEIRHWAAAAGEPAGVACAEGFRQHLARPFPRDNILVDLLGAHHER